MQFPKLAPWIRWTTPVLVLGVLPCEGQVDYASVRSIFLRKCVSCHGAEKVKAGLRLDSRSATLKGGNDGRVILPGNAAGSTLIHVVEDGDMPPKGAPLSARDIKILRDWINAGAPAGGGGPKPPGVAGKPGVEAEGPVSVPSGVPARIVRTPHGILVVPGEAVPSDGSLPAPTGPAPPSISLPLPPAVRRQVDFDLEVQPILERSCLRCHGREKPRGRLRLDRREAALRGGASGPAIIPGKSADSPLIHFVARTVEDMEMPPVGEGDPLSPQEIAVLRAWIDQGAKWGGTVVTPKLAFSLAPSFRSYSVRGNKQKFREHAWLPEGGTEAIGRFNLENWIDPDTRFTAEGALDSPETYKITMALQRQDLGFFRGGFEQFRRYSNNYGGYYEPFADRVQPAFRSDRNFHLDSGRAWAELGLTLPRWPEITLGYEYRFKDGDKPTLHWGPSTQGMDTRNIFPAYKHIVEDVHIFRGDVKYDWDGLEIENNLMAEFTEATTRRFEALPALLPPFSTAAPTTFTTIQETRDSVQWSNTFSLQKEVTDWWLLSGGYYYSHLDTDATFQQSTVDAMGEEVLGQHWFSQPIVLDWNTHIFNVSTRLGPWEGFTLSAGVQSNWERQSAIGDSTLFFGLPDPSVPIPPFFSSVVSSNKQTVTTTEHLTLRFDQIPRTVLYGGIELEHENSDFFEEDTGMFQPFARMTESGSRDQDYKAGITLSPRRGVTLNSHYRYRLKETDYDHIFDESFTTADSGYPAFILARDTEMREVMVRLNMQPQPWLRTLLSWQTQKTDYTTNTDSVTFGISSDTPGGRILAGNYDSDTYSLNLVVTPCPRLTLNSSFSWHDSRTRTASNEDPAVENYEGDIASVLIGATYLLGKKTHLNAHYSLSKGDFSQDNATAGLPLGIEYDQRSVQAGLTTRILDKIQLDLHYLYQEYQEPTSGLLNDYTAHGIFGSCTLTW